MAAAAGKPPAPSIPPTGLGLERIHAALAPTLTLAREVPSNGAEAAVALVLRENGAAGAPSLDAARQRFRAGSSGGGALDTELLLIRRAERRDDPWSGQMALPGGRKDPADVNVLDTAIRETFEEVGLRLEHDARLIGRLPSVPAIARGRLVGMTVVPLVFHLTGDATLRTNHEVAETLWVPLSGLSCGAWDTFVDYPVRGGAPVARLPAWSVDGRIVWGLTHRMIMTFLELLERTSDVVAGATDEVSEEPSR